MAKVEKVNTIDGFSIANDEKFRRAIYGANTQGGKLSGGVGENASNAAKLAEYDRLGGLILKGKAKVKTGSFFDFEDTKKPRTTPKVVLVFRDLNGEEVEIADGEEIPMEVKAAEIQREKKAEAIKEKSARAINSGPVSDPEAAPKTTQKRKVAHKGVTVDEE